MAEEKIQHLDILDPLPKDFQLCHQKQESRGQFYKTHRSIIISVFNNLTFFLGNSEILLQLRLLKNSIINFFQYINQLVQKIIFKQI